MLGIIKFRFVHISDVGKNIGDAADVSVKSPISAKTRPGCSDMQRLNSKGVACA
jgi:hypothetical protein